MKKKWSGERLETFIYSRDTIEHLHRYAITFEIIKGKNVLDIASGEGYGSHLMSRFARNVSGVDIDNESVELAAKKYKSHNLNYKQGSATQIPFDDNTFDVVVSFETIEHIAEHNQMIIEIKRVLKKDGVLIISTPDKMYYSDVRKFNNHFHVKELYREEFKDLISTQFDYCALYDQLYLNGISIICNEKANINNHEMVFTGDYNKIENTALHPLYLIAIAGVSQVKVVETSFFDGSNIIVKEAFAEFQKSNVYKVGNFILKPLKILKSIFK